jgi:hypothetical protein
MINTLAAVDELELVIEELLSGEEELIVELDSDTLELLITTSDDDEIDIDEEITEDETSDDELTEEIAVDELLIDDEIATVDELTALLELDPPPPLPPPPQATRLQPRIPMIIGFSKDVIIKFSRYRYSSLHHKCLRLVYQQL